MKKILEKFASLKLAIALIGYLVVTSILATLVPQGLSPEEYRTLYPRPLAELVVQTGFGSFFGSILFIVPALLFFANLSTCTIKRLVRELQRKGKKRFGPDILHLGLMLLVLGSVWSYSRHWEGSVMLAQGEGVNLPDGSVMYLKEFRFERYDDGRPRDWVSVVDLIKDGVTVKENFEIRVNTPLRYAGLTLYQASYSDAPYLLLKDSLGKEFRMSQGEELILGDIKLFLMAPEGASTEAMGSEASSRALLKVGDAKGERVVRAAPGDRIGTVSVEGFRNGLTTGIQAVVDPGYPLVFAAFILIAFGTALTFFQKLKEAA